MARNAVKEARKYAKNARWLAQQGRCRDALHYLAVSSFWSGVTKGHREGIAGPPNAKGWFGKSGHMGARAMDLQRTIFRLCRVG